MNLAEIAERISAHLHRFEADPIINAPINARPDEPYSGHHPYYHPYAVSNGRTIHIAYVTYQGRSILSKAQAITYLEWLDAGNVGRHHRIIGTGKTGYRS